MVNRLKIVNIIVTLLVAPGIVFATGGNYTAQNPIGASNTSKQRLEVWKKAQTYNNNHLIKNSSEYNAFAVEMRSKYGIKMLPWSRWATTNMNERAKRYRGAGLNAGLAVKVSVLCDTLSKVYKRKCKFYPSMVRTSGKGVLSKSQHRIDQGCKAVDLYVDPKKRVEVFRMASNLNLTGIGVYTNHLNMVHVDTGNRRAWTHGYKSGKFVKLDHAHSKRPLYPPVDVLTYLGVKGIDKGVIDALGDGTVQYDSSNRAMHDMLSNYAQKHPELYYTGVNGIAQSPVTQYVAPSDEELWGGEDRVYDQPQLNPDSANSVQEYIIYVLYKKPITSSFIINGRQMEIEPEDITYTMVDLEKPKSSWLQIIRNKLIQ